MDESSNGDDDDDSSIRWQIINEAASFAIVVEEFLSFGSLTIRAPCGAVGHESAFYTKNQLITPGISHLHQENQQCGNVGD
uniref:Uncharacterized protein n=1 Tax=Glossina pallidipes TaxID=7398 RepID=A0A1B0AG34_GLOPL